MAPAIARTAFASMKPRRPFYSRDMVMPPRFPLVHNRLLWSCAVVMLIRMATTPNFGSNVPLDALNGAPRPRKSGLLNTLLHAPIQVVALLAVLMAHCNTSGSYRPFRSSSSIF